MLKPNLYLRALVAFWAVGLILWPISTNPPSRRDESTGSGEGLYKSQITKANFGLLGVRFYETNENRKRWNIRSAFAELHRKENYAYLQEVDADFFAEKTGNLVVTKSDYGVCNLEKNEVELEGNVTILSKRGYLFSMDKLRYEGKTHEFFSDQVVHMRGPDVEKPMMLLKGTGMRADIDREYFQLKSDVTAQKKLKSSEWMKITSDRGEFYTDDQHAIFKGRVHSVLPKAAIDSNEMEIEVKQEQEFISARGNVILKTKKRTGRADSAFIEVGNSVIVLEGRASVDSADNQIRGRRILLYSDEDRVEVEQAEGKIIQ